MLFDDLCRIHHKPCLNIQYCCDGASLQRICCQLEINLLSDNHSSVIYVGIKLSLFLTATDVISIESPRQTAGDAMAYVARESPVSDIEGVSNTVRNFGATVNFYKLFGFAIQKKTTIFSMPTMSMPRLLIINFRLLSTAVCIRKFLRYLMKSSRLYCLKLQQLA